MQPGKITSDSIRNCGHSLLGMMDKLTQQVDWSRLSEFSELILEAKRVFVTGAGRSGLVARMFAMRLMHAGLAAYVTGDTTTPAAGSGDLLVAVSCTGATGYTGYLAKRARELGATTVVITSEPKSELTTDADLIVTIPPTEGDIVLRASVFEHTASLCLESVFNVLSDHIKLDLSEFQSRHANLE